MNDKLTIYCCYHRPEDKNDDIPGVQWVFGPDDNMNEFINEFSMFKYILENDKDSDYIGTSHYRRRISPNSFDKNLVNEHSCQTMTRLTRDIVGNEYGTDSFWNLEGWCSNSNLQCPWLWNDYKEYLIGKYGEHNKYLDLNEKQKTDFFEMLQFSSFIMTRNHFFNLCDFIFGFFDFVDAKHNLQKDPNKVAEFIDKKFENYENKIWWVTSYRRIFAYFGERLVSVYIQANMDNYTDIW
jgi:hypothetical protein